MEGVVGSYPAGLTGNESATGIDADAIVHILRRYHAIYKQEKINSLRIP